MGEDLGRVFTVLHCLVHQKTNRVFCLFLCSDVAEKHLCGLGLAR